MVESGPKSMVNPFKKHESSAENVRPYAIDIASETTIELTGITDHNWKVCKPLLDKLRETRKQTESGEIQSAPIPFREIRKMFPEKISQQTIFKSFRILNIALSPSGWSVIRVGEKPIKPVYAPWFLRGPEDNGVQNKGQSKQPKRENIHDKTVSEDKKQVAMKRFDRLAFGTSLLHQCLSNLTHPDAKAIFTKDPAQAMLSLLPTDIKLQDLIDKKTPLEYFQESIENAVNSMRGRNYQQLSEKQQTIIELWEELKKQSGQPPKTVVFEHFSRPNSNKPLDQGNNDTS